MLRYGSILFLLSISFATTAGQDPFVQKQAEKVQLERDLPPDQTISSLSARLRLLTGDLDPNLLKNMAEQLKNNPKMSPDDWMKQLGKDGGGKGFDDLLKSMKSDPKAFESLKDFASKFGKNGLTVDQLKDFFKKFGEGGMKAPDINPSNIKLPNIEAPKLNGEIPDFKPGKFELPEGSSQFLKDLVTSWEKNVGSIDANPNFKNALQDFLKKGEGFNPGEIKNWLGNKGFDMKNLDGLFGKSDFKVKLPDAMQGPKDVTVPQMKIPSFSFGSPSLPSAPSFGGGWSFPGLGNLGSGASAGIPILIIVVLIVLGVIVWWMWPQISASLAAKAKPTITLPAGFDPRGVNDRESLIKAFEVLSMVLCGEDAKVWNHATIGKALREFMSTDPAGIERLAVLYALARYTPAGESLHPDSVKEARRTLCQLAGVPEA